MSCFSYAIFFQGIRSVVAAAIMGWLIVAFPLSVRAEDMRVLSYPLPPVTYEQDGFVQGPAARVVVELLKAVDVKAPAASVSVARLLTEVEYGGNVVGFPLARNPEREPLFTWIVEIYQDAFSFATLASIPRVNNLDQARALNLITVNNRSAPLNYLNAAGGFTNLDVANSEIQNALKLFTGRVDAWFSVRSGFRAIARINGFDPDQMHIGDVIHPVTAWMIGPKNMDAAFVAKIRQRLTEIKGTGFYSEIMRDVLPVDMTVHQQD
ncbi:putative PBPb domain-containing protein [Azospirillaceae bacterium]